MVEPLQLATDVTQDVAALALPALLWLFLYLFAWEDPEVARDTGFGRRTFWLLLPAGVLAELGTLPFFGWDGSILAINVAGGVIPILLSVFFLYRLLGRNGRSLALFVGLFSVETAVLFALVVLFPSGPFAAVAALGVVIGASVAVAIVAGFGSGSVAGSISPSIAVVFALSSAVLYATFLTTTPEAGIGIVSIFPYYLLSPLAGGFVAALVAVTWIGGDGRAGVPLAYACTTFGVLVGADVLRQPPLYGTGGADLLSIGGAGLEDLLYLSGLLAAAAAYLLYRYVRPRPMEVPEDVAGGEADPATPPGLLHRAQLLSASGRTARSVQKSADAAWAAAQQARRLYGAPPGRRDRPWEGLPVSPWVVADHENLEALAAWGPTDPRDADRAWIAASGIVQAAAEASRPRYPTLFRRSSAFGIDLAITLAPAVLVWVAIIQSVPGNIAHLVDSVTFNASILGYAAYAFLYLVLGEALFGTTIGKYVLGLEVSDRSVRRPGPFSVVLRNIPKLVPLTVAGVAGALELAILIDGAIGTTSTTSGSTASALLEAIQLLSIGLFVAIGFVACAAVSWLAIAASRERQRLGDYVAGTWVIFRAPPMGLAAAPRGPPARSG